MPAPPCREPQMSTEPFAGGAARADLCRLLSACYYQPDAAFEQEGLFDNLVEAASGVSGELAAGAAAVRKGFRAQSLEALLIDYGRLFLGPPRPLAAPYGSVWLEAIDGTVMQASTTAVMALYAEGGFEIAEDFLELPDHIAAELEFLYQLTVRLLRARVDGDAAAMTLAAALRERLLTGHVGRWVAPFARAVRTDAGTAYYRSLVDLTERFLRAEALAPL